MLNFVKQGIYRAFSLIYPVQEVDDPALRLIARTLFCIFGYAVVDYGSVKVRVTPHEHLDRYIIRKGHINPFVTSAIAQVLSDGGIFLDVGANHGILSLLAARNPQIKVFALEPSPRELGRLFANLSLNPGNNVSVIAYGLGEAAGRVDLVLTGNDNPGMNSLREVRAEGVPVPCNFAPLTELVSPSVLEQTRVCKIDIEGQEMHVLKSLKPCMHLLKRCVFVVEIGRPLLQKMQFAPDDIYAFFHDEGFRHQYGKPEDYDYWEETFYHPEFNHEIAFSAVI